MQAAHTTDEKHAHLLTRANIQMCQGCHRLFIITYERNEKGEAVETGFELDFRVTSTGVVSPQFGDWKTIKGTGPFRSKKEDNRADLSCF